MRKDALGIAQRVDAVGDDPQRVDVEPGVGLVEHGEARLEQRHLQHLHALLLAAGEADVERPLQHVLVDLQLCAAPRTARMKSGVVSSASPRERRCALSEAFRNVIVATPGISIGYWKARNTPLRGARVGREFEEVFAVEAAPRRTDFIIRLAGDDVGERRLARAVRPHDRGDLAGPRR